MLLKNTKHLGKGFLADIIPLFQYKLFETTAMRNFKRDVKLAKEFLEKKFNEHLKIYSPGIGFVVDKEIYYSA